MSKEIERKFLVKNEDWMDGNHSVAGAIIQGYILNTSKLTIRYRYNYTDAIGYITVKGAKVEMSCDEYEMEITDAETNRSLRETLNKTNSIYKIRFNYPYKGFKFEIDEYAFDNYGLIVAEVELPSEDTEVELPSWIGEEITNDKRYLNCNLVKNPYKNWRSNDL